MTLLIVLVLAAVLVVIAISLIKKTARNKFKNSTPTTTVTPSTLNPGSIPDEPGTKGDGGSMLSSGKQG